MNFQDLIKTVKAQEGIGWGEMAGRAHRAGYPSFSKSQLSRAASEPLRAFPSANMPAFAAALRLPLLEVLCACAESLYGGRFTFHMGPGGKSVIVSSARTLSGDGEEQDSLVVYEVVRRSVANVDAD